MGIYPLRFLTHAARPRGSGARQLDREDASSMVTAVATATANTTEGNSRVSREVELLCSHSHGESIDFGLRPDVIVLQG